MVRIVKKLPVPIAGLMLALGAAGNLVSSYGDGYKNIFGSLSFIVFFLLIVKIVTEYKGVCTSLNNPVIASVAPTFSMGTMILSTYLNPYTPVIAYGMWLLGLLLHCLLILYFTKKFILSFNIKKVFPSYFVVYVGIVVGSVTAPAYNLLHLGQIIFWFGFIAYLALLPFVVYRVFKIKEVPEPALPTITIFAAPASLCLAGYMSAFPEKNMVIVGLLAGFSLIMTLGVLFYMPKMLRIRFYPSYSAFTFPFVISGIGLKLTNGFLVKTNQGIDYLYYILKFQEVFAVLIVVYVLIRYTISIMLEVQVETKAQRHKITT